MSSDLITPAFKLYVVYFLNAIGSRSATVVGENAGLADAVATALIVAGRDGAHWFSKTELVNYSCWVVDRHENTLWEISRS